MKKLFPIGGLALGLFAISVHADECTAEIEKIDSNFTISKISTLPEDSIKKIHELREKGAALCSAGSIEEGQAALSEAKVLLGIE